MPSEHVKGYHPGMLNVRTSHEARIQVNGDAAIPIDLRTTVETRSSR